ncbi:hypothetical protein P154DRAFT_578338 [Amniculicola lignicola CBS 123094]|uniref:DNA damage-responsive protein 48 n=1 Tax=Amniculicola lignicola CBS 123094 TaxID=1392246 RepID=A0A6A5W8H7_9PLEO|nr:hypothetical protein P154DRAFT_578338 [Amniculicola lignicola CBS 123094]
MDFVNKFTGGGEQKEGQQQQQSSNSDEQKQGGGILGAIGDKVNSAAGGGQEGEKNEDYLDKGVDFIQEKYLGAGDQSNESAVEQAKDEQISDFIRKQYKTMAGSDIPIEDKKTTFG